MRWMESLVERTGAGGLPTIQRLWAVDRHDQSSIRASNRDYLLRLAQSLRDLGAHDPHVFAIERELLRIRPD